jgi:hypothetical protein
LTSLEHSWMRSRNKAGRRQLSRVFYVHQSNPDYQDEAQGVCFEASGGWPWCRYCNVLRRGYASPIDIVLRRDLGFTFLVSTPGIEVATKQLVATLKRHMPELVVGEAMCQRATKRKLNSFYMPTERRVQFYGAGGIRSYTKCKQCGETRMSTFPSTYALRSDLGDGDFWMTGDNVIVVSTEGMALLRSLVGTDVRFRPYPVRDALLAADASRRPLVE